MLFLLQLGLGIAFLGYTVLAFFDLFRGTLIILSGLGLLAFAFTLKGIAILLRNIYPTPPVVTEKVRTWKVIAP